MKRKILGLGLLGVVGIGMCLFPNEALASTNAISTGMPWDTGVNKMFESFTGPLPKAAATVGIGTGGIMWVMGTESQLTKLAMRFSLGTGTCLAAPSVVEALSGVTTAAAGCLI